MEFNATFLVSAISFIAFVFIMNTIFYKPLENIVEERNKSIEDDYAQANNANERAKQLDEDRENRLNKASGDAKQNLLNKTNEAKLQKDDLIKNARNDASEKVVLNKQSLAASSVDAQSQLKSDVLVLAQQISNKILGEHIEINNVDNDAIEHILCDR